MTDLDREYLKELRQKIIQVHSAATTYGTYQSHELTTVVDNLARVAAFLADLRIQEIEEGKIVAGDPCSYLDGKLDIAHTVMMRYRNKTAKDTLV